MRLFLITILSVLLATASAGAQQLSASYKGYASGILAGKLDLALALGQSSYQFRMNGGKAGITALVDWRINYAEQGVYDGRFVRTSAYQSDYFNRGREKTRAIRYSPQGAVVTPPVDAQPDEAVTPQQTASAIAPIAGFINLGMAVKNFGRCDLNQEIFDGRSLLRITTQQIATENISVRGFSGQAVRCRIFTTPLAGRATREKERSNIRPVDVWLARPVDGAPIFPVKFEANVRGFRVTFELVSAS